MSEEIAVMDTGTDCSDSSRRRAVTTISSMLALAMLWSALSCAATGMAVATSASGLAARARNMVDFITLRLPFGRSEEHTSELQSLMRNSYAAFCLTKKNKTIKTITYYTNGVHKK